jgi:hypothetical protein
MLAITVLLEHWLCTPSSKRWALGTNAYARIPQEGSAAHTPSNAGLVHTHESLNIDPAQQESSLWYLDPRPRRSRREFKCSFERTLDTRHKVLDQDEGILLPGETTRRRTRFPARTHRDRLRPRSLVDGGPRNPGRARGILTVKIHGN